MVIRIKRIYDEQSKDDGYRVLVDRLWPRGINKKEAGIDLWMKNIAPSEELRKWFAHDPGKWQEFKKKYFDELLNNKNLCEELLKNNHEVLTLLYSAKHKMYNNAAALKEFLEKDAYKIIKNKTADLSQ